MRKGEKNVFHRVILGRKKLRSGSISLLSPYWPFVLLLNLRNYWILVSKSIVCLVIAANRGFIRITI